MREERSKYKITRQCVVEEETKILGENLSTALKAEIGPLVNELEYKNSNRPSKPYLPNALELSKSLLPTRLCRTMSLLAFQIPQYDQLLPPMNGFLCNCFSMLQIFLTALKWVRKVFGLMTSHGYDNGEVGEEEFREMV